MLIRQDICDLVFPLSNTEYVVRGMEYRLLLHGLPAPASRTAVTKGRSVNGRV